MGFLETHPLGKEFDVIVVQMKFNVVIVYPNYEGAFKPVFIGFVALGKPAGYGIEDSKRVHD